MALLTALGMQPSSGIPDAVRREVEALARGEKVGGRRVRAPEQAHGLTTAVRLGDQTATSLLIRRLSATRDEKNPPALRLAAVLALGDRADRIHATERLLVARMLERAIAGEQELLVMGLANIALGRLVGADLAEGSTSLLAGTQAASLLEKRATTGPWYLRGYGAIAWALAARGVAQGWTPPRDAAEERRAPARCDACSRIAALEADLRAAAAVGLGVMGAPDARGRTCGPSSRTRRATPTCGRTPPLPSGSSASAAPTSSRALEAAAVEDGPERLRGAAALGLSLLGRSESVAALVAQLGGGTAHLPPGGRHARARSPGATWTRWSPCWRWPRDGPTGAGPGHGHRGPGRPGGPGGASEPPATAPRDALPRPDDGPGGGVHDPVREGAEEAPAPAGRAGLAVRAAHEPRELPCAHLVAAAGVQHHVTSADPRGYPAPSPAPGRRPARHEEMSWDASTTR